MKLLTPLAIIAVCVGMYFLYITPGAIEVNALVNQKNEYNDVLQKAKELTTKRDELSTSYNSISAADIERLNKIIPAKFDPVVMAHDLSAIASQNKLIFADFKTASASDGDRSIVVDPQSALPYKITQISFKVVGQYSDFLRFLNSAEMNLRLLDVVGLDIIPNGATDKANDNSMQFILLVNTYSLQ